MPIQIVGTPPVTVTLCLCSRSRIAGGVMCGPGNTTSVPASRQP